ncbi:hypothetical protein [Microbacterium maritypicum]
MFASYRNGYIPDNLLITFNVGYSTGEGQWKHQLSAGTYSKHLALVALARKNTGLTLAISNGWGAYRPYPAQVYARKVHGNGAATPGTSSHGGFWEGQQTLAIDYGNWSYVYGGNRSAFYRDARAVGFEPGLISPQRGYPDEPWHVVDKNPWAAGSAAAGNSTEDDMSVDDIYNARDADNRNMLDLGRQIRSDLAAIRAELLKAARLNIESDYAAMAGILQRGYKYDVRPGGVGADWKLGPTVFESLSGAQGAALTADQVKAVADAVVKAIGKPTVTIDYAAIADAVNDDAAKRLAG